MRTEHIMKITRAIDAIREIARGYDTEKEKEIHRYLTQIERIMEAE